MLQKILYVLVLMTICMEVYAGRLFHSISIKNGLSDVYVSSIVQDDEGYMWIATSNGLNRFDGYRFRKYSRKHLGFTSDMFSDVLKDGAGNIWAFSSDCSLLYDREADCLVDDLSEVNARFGFPDNDVNDIFIDNDGNIWCVSDAIYLYDFAKAELNMIEKPAQKVIWVGSGAGNRYYMTEDGSLWKGNKIIAEFPDATRRLRFYIDSNEVLWVFCPVVQILKCYDPRNGKWSDHSDMAMLSNSFINTIADDNKGNLWLGTNSGGIIVADHSMSSWHHILSDESHQFSLPSNHINYLYSDNRNNIWVGTSKKGLACCPLDNTRPEIYRLKSIEDISTIIEDRHGALWVGTDGKGLIQIDIWNGEQKEYTSAEGKVPSDLILDSFLDKDGNLYFSTYGNGVFLWQNGKYKPVRCQDVNFEEMIKFSREIFKDKHENLWIRTFSKGVCCLKPDGTWVHYTRQNSALKTNYITSMAYSYKDDVIHLGTSIELYDIPASRGELKRSEFEGNITELFCDSRGLLWIGTIDGLYVRDRYRNIIQKVSMNDDVYEFNILGIASDRDNNIWVTSSNGFADIVVIDDPQADSLTFRCYPYFEEDGIGNVTFGKKAIYCTKQGDILIGAGNKIVRVVPERPHDADINASVAFTGIKISGNNDISGILPEHVCLDHTDHLTLDISAMDFPNRHRISYEYRFRNEEAWTRIEGNRIHLSNLNPGIHDLQVRATGPNIKCKTPASLIVTVKPPFWKSKAALMMYAALLILFIILIYFQLQEKNRRTLAAERHEMDEAKLQFFTNICHDLRTPLTLILTPLGKMMKQYDDHPVVEDLKIVERNAQALMNEVNQLLDFRKLDKNKASFSPNHDDICRFVQQTCEMFNILFSDNSSRLVTDISRDEILMDFDPDKMQRILYNLLSNAYKYNSDGGLITVSVSKKGKDTVVISVADEGIGIKDECKPRIFDRFYQEKHANTSYTGNGIGLHIVKEYVLLHDGIVSVCDNEPGGSIFTLELPIRGTSSRLQPEAVNAKNFNGTGRPTILIVEDNDEFRRYLSECLSEIYDVIEASDGKSALDVLDRFSFSIVITDVMMPVMNGMELCNRMKNDVRFSHIPVIMLTAAGSRDQMIKGLKEGADEYIVKPFDYDILMVKIERLLNLTQENRNRYSAKEEIASSDLTLSKVDAQLLDRINALIEENIANTEYSVEDLSKEVGISRSGLYKKLMFITGKSPIEFIRIARLRKGRQMLDEGETSISQIAWSVGISPKLFAKYFRQEFGCLPSEYIHKD